MSPKAASTTKAIEKLRDEIRHHDELYYVENSPDISDREYDELLERLQKLELREIGHRLVDALPGRHADVVS